MIFGPPRLLMIHNSDSFGGSLSLPLWLYPRLLSERYPSVPELLHILIQRLALIEQLWIIEFLSQVRRLYLHLARCDALIEGAASDGQGWVFDRRQFIVIVWEVSVRGAIVRRSTLLSEGRGVHLLFALTAEESPDLYLIYVVDESCVRSCRVRLLSIVLWELIHLVKRCEIHFTHIVIIIRYIVSLPILSVMWIYTVISIIPQNIKTHDVPHIHRIVLLLLP